MQTGFSWYTQPKSYTTVHVAKYPATRKSPPHSALSSLNTTSSILPPPKVTGPSPAAHLRWGLAHCTVLSFFHKCRQVSSCVRRVGWEKEAPRLAYEGRQRQQRKTRGPWPKAKIRRGAWDKPARPYKCRTEGAWVTWVGCPAPQIFTIFKLSSPLPFSGVPFSSLINCLFLSLSLGPWSNSLLWNTRTWKSWWISSGPQYLPITKSQLKSSVVTPNLWNYSISWAESPRPVSAWFSNFESQTLPLTCLPALLLLHNCHCWASPSPCLPTRPGCMQEAARCSTSQVYRALTDFLVASLGLWDHRDYEQWFLIVISSWVPRPPAAQAPVIFHKSKLNWLTGHLFPC